MSARRPARPRFIWQGALIILPAILLALAGLYSLRQDRLLAEHEAAQEAHRHAVAIAAVRLPEQLFAQLPDSSVIARSPRTGPGTALDDPIVRGAGPHGGSDRFVLFLSDDDALIAPPAMTKRAAPQPLGLNELNPAQRSAWQRWVATTRAEPSALDGALAAVINAQLPDPWIANAHFRSAIIARDSGNSARAIELFRSVIDRHPDATGETGVSLRVLSSVELARLSPAYPGALGAICAELVAKPQPSTETFLEVAAAIDPPSAAWRNTFELHERTRAFHHVLRESDKSRLVFENRTYLALSRPDTGGRWIIALSVEALHEACERAVASQTLPAHFRAEISVGEGKTARGGTLPLARIDREVSSFRGALPIAVDVFLTDPQTFYAQQRARTVRIAALIVLSAAAVLVGFFAAWRSFRKQQQLNEMKTNFVSSVSHELRAPIASMRLMAEELEEGAPPTRTKLREYHHFIGQECRRLSALVENVLDFSRREQGRESFEFAPVDIEKMVRETIGVMEAYARERGVELCVHVEGEARRRSADSGALQRLLVNLLDNAIKHSPQGAAVRTHLAFAPGQILLSIADEGPGVAHEERSRIFERFYRVGSELRRETAGVGLGLAIVKHIAEAHGGTVRVESEIGHGSRFIVELPLSALSDAIASPEVAVL